MYPLITCYEASIDAAPRSGGLEPRIGGYELLNTERFISSDSRSEARPAPQADRVKSPLCLCDSVAMSFSCVFVTFVTS